MKKDSTLPINKKAYYSHAKIIARSEQERKDIELLETLGFVVDNPYHPKYIEFWETEGFEFSKILIDNNDIFVFRALSDGRIPAGVAKEVAIAETSGKPIIELPYSLNERVKLNVTETVLEYEKRRKL